MGRGREDAEGGEEVTAEAVGTRRGVFYGWRIAAAGAGLQFLYSALLLQAFGAYVAVLSAELGWSKTALAGGAAIQSVEGALLGPLLGWLVDRFGPRIMVQGGVVALGLGFLAFSTIDTLGGFYAAMVLISIGATFCGYFPLSVALVHFFKRQRGRALSLMSLGLAAGGLLVPVLGWAMESFGWRQTALGSGALILVLGWPLASMVRRNPAEVGALVDGQAVAPPERSSASPTEAEGEFTVRQALGTPAFWLLGVGHALALLVVVAVNVHAISHLKEGLGYSLREATLFITLMTVGQGGGMLLGALVSERWDKRQVVAGCMLAHMVGLLMLTFAVHPLMLFAFAMLHGGAWGLRSPYMQALRADYFGLRAIGMILGLSAVFVALGQAAGPMIAGVLADATGSYRSGFVILALLAGFGSVLFTLARRPVLR